MLNIPKITGCYLLCYDRPYPSELEKHPRRHYLGSADDICKRIRDHASGKGGRMPRAMVEQGISFSVAQIWITDDHRHKEIELKKRRNHSLYCPRCAKNHETPASILVWDVPGEDCEDLAESSLMALSVLKDAGFSTL
jgi:predicted GIY-YIG superfamily endonuclease